MIWLRTKLYSIISSFVYPLILLATILSIAYGFLWFDAPERHQKIIYIALIATFSLLSSILLYRRYRLIEDTSPTVLNSAAQGYVELQGEASLYEHEVARSLHHEVPPMVWYRTLFRTSWSGFLLHDDKGRCTIDPRNAEVITPLYKYNQYIYNAIYPDETIYALGDLETLKKHHTEYERKGLILSKLGEWKRSKFRFLAYFDTNKDGKIDEAELKAAKNAAEREVDYDMEAAYQLPATHVVSSPNDGRPFILSSIHPDDLIKRYKIATLAHFVNWVFLSSIALLLN